MENNSNLKQSLERLCSKFLKEKLYTHYYVSCGDLNSNQLLLESSNAEGLFFDLSSLTKVIVTTPLVLNETLNEDDSLRSLVPKGVMLNAVDHLLDIKIYDILRHQSGLPAWINFYTDCSDAGSNRDTQDKHDRIIRTLSRVKIDHDYIGKDRYSDLGMVLLGLLLELKYNTSLDELFVHLCKDVLADPSLTKIIGYPSCLPKDAKFISTGKCMVRGIETTGVVHDENCGALSGVTGHAGLFSTGIGLNLYLKSFLRSDLGKKVIKLNEKFIRPNNPSLLGFRQGNDPSSNSFYDGLTMGHLGFTGTAFWLEPKSGFYAVILTNRTIYSRLDSRIKSFRREVLGILNEAARCSRR